LAFLEFPVAVFLVVVVSTEWFEFFDRGVVVLGPGEGMVDVTVVTVHPAGGEDTFGISDLDETFLGSGGPSPGGEDVDELVLVVDPVPPFRLVGISDQLAGDVGDDWSPSGYLSGLVIQFQQRGQVDPDIDHTPVRTRMMFLMVSGEEVQEDVGSDLVDISPVTFTFGGFGEAVDPAHGGVGPVCGEVGGMEHPLDSKPREFSSGTGYPLGEL
jgi:hypothetical protein